MKALILCGGNGIRLEGFSEYRPKAMTMIGQRPILWHIMKRYALFGVNEFVLALGMGGELIRDYFLSYEEHTNDIELTIGQQGFIPLNHHQENGWKVTLSDTGMFALSGARVARLKQYLTEDKEFMVHYSDVLSDIDLHALIAFHKKKRTIATIAGVIPQYRINEFEVRRGIAQRYYQPEKYTPSMARMFINGGHMIFTSEIFSYLNQFNECSLEIDVFEQLMNDKELAIFPHHGFWRWLDGDRDYQYLSQLAHTNKMYWLMKGEKK